jgi:hypothetical protein
VGGVCDVTEGLTYQGIKWEDEDADVADVFNQMNRDLNLDEFARMWHYEEFKYSQVVVGVWWGRKTYTVRGRTPGPGRRADRRRPDQSHRHEAQDEAGPEAPQVSFDIACPVALTFLAGPAQGRPASAG